jgi:Leucine rich repeat
MRTLIALATLAVAGPLQAQEDKPQARTPAEQAAIAKVRELGGQVLEIAQNDPRLDVAYHLADGEVTDQHLEPLKDMPGTLWLNLRGTAVTDAGLTRIAGLKGLEKLHLEKTKITDAGLAHLKGLENLKYLNLYGTAVTDAGLEPLTGLKNLERLYVWETKVTEAGIEKIKQALPNIEVVPDPAAERRLAEIEKQRIEELKRQPVEAPRPPAPAPEKKEG